MNDINRYSKMIVELIIKGLSWLGDLPLVVWPFIWALVTFITTGSLGIAGIVFFPSFMMWVMCKQRYTKK